MMPFNDWIDTVQHDSPVIILENAYKQSEVLFKVDPETYKVAYADYQAYIEDAKGE